jgi:hypothetical protein
MATKKPISSLETLETKERLRREDYERRSRNRELRAIQKAESISQLFSLQDSEQSPAYKYGLCIAKLQNLFKTNKDVEEWLNSLESGLPKTPMQYMEEGKFEIVERLIGMIEHGIPS